MDNRWRFLYLIKSDGVTEKARQIRRMEEPEQARYLVCRKMRILKGEGVTRMERGNPSTEAVEASFQEKLLTEFLLARTDNGHTWVRRES